MPTPCEGAHASVSLTGEHNQTGGLAVVLLWKRHGKAQPPLPGKRGLLQQGSLWRLSAINSCMAGRNPTGASWHHWTCVEKSNCCFTHLCLGDGASLVPRRAEGLEVEQRFLIGWASLPCFAGGSSLFCACHPAIHLQRQERTWKEEDKPSRSPACDAGARAGQSCRIPW